MTKNRVILFLFFSLSLPLMGVYVYVWLNQYHPNNVLLSKRLICLYGKLKGILSLNTVHSIALMWVKIGETKHGSNDTLARTPLSTRAPSTMIRSAATKHNKLLVLTACPTALHNNHTP